jgi:hypothetical protein
MAQVRTAFRSPPHAMWITEVDPRADFFMTIPLGFPNRRSMNAANFSACMRALEPA